MAKFMAVHTLPVDRKQALALAAQISEKPREGFVWKQSYCDFTNHKFFCDWEAPSKDALESAFKARNMPFDAIYPVEVLQVAIGKFEK
jgi:Nickel responsive protein SCO4226-like